MITYSTNFTRPRSLRPTPAAFINAAVFIATVIPVAIVPLLPRISERLGIGAVQAGVLLAAPNFAMVIVSIPSGLIADRISARAVTRAAAVLLTLATFGQALATTYATMLAARLVVGVAYGVIWTTALAWIADIEARRGSEDQRAVASSTTTGGLGLIAAPGIAGVLVGVLGISGSFLVLALVAGSIAAALFTIDRGAPRPVPRAQRAAAPSALRVARSEPVFLSGGVALILIGLTTGMLNLLAPLELRAAGISASSIGFTFMGAAGLYILASGLVVRVGGRMIRVTTLGIALVAMAAALTPAAVSVSAIAVGATLLLQSPFRATIAAVSYPLGAARAQRAQLGHGAAMGMLNVVWAAAAVVGPLLGGALAQFAGARIAFGVVAGCLLLAGAWLVRIGPALTRRYAGAAGTTS